MKQVALATALLCALLLAACGGKSEPKPRVQSFLEVEKPIRISDLTLPGLVRLPGGALVMTLFIHSTFPSATDPAEAIAVLRSDDNGVSWKELSRIPSYLTYGVWGYDLDANGRGGLCMTWVSAVYGEDSPSPFKAVMFSRSDDGGATWTEPVRVSGIAIGQRRNPVASTLADQIAIAWLDGGDQDPPRPSTEMDVHFSSSSDGGATWSPSRCIELDLDRRLTQSDVPAFCRDASGSLHCGYFSARRYDNRRVTFWLASSANNGTAFESMAQDLGPLGNVSLAMLDGNPVLAAVYIKSIKQISIQDPQSAQEVRFYSRDRAEWNEPVRIDDDPNNRHKNGLRLVSLGARRLLAVWDDDRGGLYAAASLDGGESWGINAPLGFDSRAGITPFDVLGDPESGSFLIAASDVRQGGGDSTVLIKGRVVGEQPPE